MSTKLAILLKLLSTGGGLLLLGIVIRQFLDGPVTLSGYLNVAVLVLYSGSLLVNLLSVPKPVAVCLAILHFIAIAALLYGVVRVSGYALGESGTKAGLLEIYVIVFSAIVSLSASVLLNYFRIKGEVPH